MTDLQSSEGASNTTSTTKPFPEGPPLYILSSTTALPTQELIMSQSSSIGDADENDELVGEKILRNRHISFTTTEPVHHSAPSHFLLDPPEKNASADKPRVIHRNHSLPTQSNVQTPTIVPMAAPQPLSGMEPATTGQQVVTKKKGRFKFVEQVPVQRSVNDVVLTNETNASEIKPESTTTASITPNSSAVNLHMLPPPHPPASTSIPPEGPVLATTPIIQKKGRFVVTSFPVPTVLSIGGPTMAAPSTLPQPPIPVLPIDSGGNGTVVMPNSATVIQPINPTHSAVSMVVEGTLVQQAGAGFVVLPNEGSSIPPTGGASPQQLNPSLHSQQQLQATLGYPPPFPVPPPPPPPPNGHSPVHTPSSTANVTFTESHSPSGAYSSGGTEEAVANIVSALYEPGSAARQASPMVTSAASKSVLSRAPTAPATAPQRPHQQQQGFGKMLYFLDQMKLEVTDADQKIKSLQTDMRCLVRRLESFYDWWLGSCL
jgi:hypothetical protein